MYTVTTKEYANLLEVCEAAKQPLFVQGGFGIGKSAIPRQVFRKIAKARNLEFVEWSDLTIAQKQACIKSPEKYYAFMDARTSQMDTTALQGIPNMANTELLENIPYSWAVMMTQENANGAIFFDEINLAAPIVQSITYSAIHDRVVSDRRLGDGVYVFAAGNRQKDRAHTFDMPMPLRDRFAECEVALNTDEWLDWARAENINPHLISFVAWKPSYLNKVDTSVDQKPSTPRGVHRASNLIKGLDFRRDVAKIHQLVSISVGEGFATVFEGYTKLYKSLEWSKIFKDPDSVSDMKVDMQYTVAGGLAEYFEKAVTKKEKGGKAPETELTVANIFSVVIKLRPDLAVLSLRMMRDINVKKFSEGIATTSEGEFIADTFAKYFA